MRNITSPSAMFFSRIHLTWVQVSGYGTFLSSIIGGIPLKSWSCLVACGSSRIAIDTFLCCISYY